MTDGEAGTSPPGGARKARALIVDDHPAFRAGLRAMLEAGGVEVAGEAGTGVQAIESVRLMKPDVVLMDIQMPDMDGLTATARIKAEWPGVCVIIMTAHESTEYLREALEAGASGYVLKDRPQEVLVKALTLVMEGESIVDSRLLAEMCRQVAASPRGRRADERLLGSLSPRENEVLRMIAQGMTNPEIAEALAYSESTVKNIVRAVIGKLGVSDRTQAAVLAARLGVVSE